MQFLGLAFVEGTEIGVESSSFVLCRGERGTVLALFDQPHYFLLGLLYLLTDGADLIVLKLLLIKIERLAHIQLGYFEWPPPLGRDGIRPESFVELVQLLLKLIFSHIQWHTLHNDGVIRTADGIIIIFFYTLHFMVFHDSQSDDPYSDRCHA